MRQSISFVAAILICAAGLAAARARADDITPDIDGFIKLQYGAASRDDNSNAHRIDGEAHLAVTTTSDTGIEYDGRVQLVRAAKSRDNGTFVSMQAAWGNIRLGDDGGAAAKLNVAAPTIGIGQIGGDLDVFGAPSALLAPYGLADDNSTRITYLSPEIDAFRVGLSYAPELSSTGIEPVPARHPQGIDAHRNEVEIAANTTRDIGETTLTAGATYVHADTKAGEPLNDLSGLGLGAHLAWNGFTLGGGYIYDGANTLPLDRRPGHVLMETVVGEVNLGLTYEEGPWALGASWAHDNRAHLAASDLTALGVAYRLAHGVTVAADLGYFQAPHGGGAADGAIFIVQTSVHF